MKTEQEHNNEQCTMNNVQWRKVKLGEVAKTFTGLTYSPNCIDKSGTLVLRSSNIKDGQLCFEDNVFVSMDIPERAIVQENDILICVRNGSRNLIGKSALITKDAVRMAFGAFMTVLRTNIIDPKLLLYIWQSNNIQRQVANNIGATINQITNADFNRFEISYPESLAAQRRIAAILTSADKVIAATQKTIAKYKQIKQGMMEDLLNEQCTMNNVQWKKVRLGEGCNRMCNGMTYDIDEKEGYLVTRIETISDGYIDYNRVGHTKELPKEDYKLLKGDILFSHINSVKHIGKVAYFDGEELLYHGMNLLLLRANNEINSKFLYYLLSSETVRQRMRTLAKSAVNQASINTTELQKFSFFIPDLTEQRRIAAILSGIDAKIAAEEKVLQKYEKVKKGLMERLLNEQ